MRFNKHKYRHLGTGAYNIEVPYRYVYTYSVRYCTYQNANRNSRTNCLIKQIVSRANNSIKKFTKGNE